MKMKKIGDIVFPGLMFIALIVFVWFLYGEIIRYVDLSHKARDYEVIFVNHGQNEKLKDYLIRHNLACWPKDVKGPNADKVYDYVIVMSGTSFRVATYKKSHPNDAVWFSCVGGDIKDAKVLIFKNDESIDPIYFNPPKHGIMMTGSEWN